MEYIFRGTFEHTIDDKGRVSVPLRFREVLQASNDDRVVITNFTMGTARCLHVYPQAVWARLEESMSARPQFDLKVMRFLAFYISRAHDCIIDKQGRILLPQLLRDYAGIKKDIVFASALAKFHIWDRDQWNQFLGEAEQGFVESFSELGL